jgi:NADH-quinone oxidoreductase subunit C
MSDTLQPTLADKAAVTQGLPEHPAVKAILALDPAALKDARLDRNELTLSVPSGQLVPALAALRDAGYNFFEDMTAVDWFPGEPRFQLTYHLLSHGFKEYIRVTALVDSDEPSIESITSLWPAANFYEREVFDLFGIRFEGHPNLRRIMLPDDWVGHPLRKDYPVEGYR